MANVDDISKIVGIISAAYPNFSPTEHTVEVYFQVLKDIPSEELLPATMQCISESGRKFAPSVGELRGTVSNIRKECANIPSSYEAWQEVGKQILDNGGDYNTPVWSHSLVEKTVRALGWRNLRMSEDQTADRARFIQAYEQFAQRAENENMLLPEVRGYIETRQSNHIKLLSERLKNGLNSPKN